MTFLREHPVGIRSEAGETKKRIKIAFRDKITVR